MIDMVMYWHGKRVDEMKPAEMLEVIRSLGAENEQLRKRETERNLRLFAAQRPHYQAGEIIWAA